MPDPDHKPNLYAILIGVDCYFPNKLPDGSSYDSLEGCVNDITQVEQFLNTRLNVTRTIKLTASEKGAKPAEASQDLWPTKKNIKQAFDDITIAAQKGDLVYIHYSGHGGRAKTCFAELKGANGLDEGLVPTDIGSSSGNYLRDLEIAYLLQTMGSGLESCVEATGIRIAKRNRYQRPARTALHEWRARYPRNEAMARVPLPAT